MHLYMYIEYILCNSYIYIYIYTKPGAHNPGLCVLSQLGPSKVLT